MTVYSCNQDWEAILSCIYVAWSSGKGQQNIRLEFEPVEQYSLFEEYIHVDANPSYAASVEEAILCKLSNNVYQKFLYVSLSSEKDVMDVIYRVMILCFAYGTSVLNNVAYKPVMRLNEISLKLGNESHHFREFLRFHEIKNSFFVAHIEPHSRIVITLGPSFSDRMPSENWMIVDDVHRQAVVHPCNSDFYLRDLTEEELSDLLKTEEENDRITDLWKVFFESIAIKERENYRCQRNLMPIWTRKHAVEFMK